MRFTKKTFNINNLPKKEIWVGEQDQSGKYNTLSLVDIRDERMDNQLYFGQVKEDYFNGLGVKYYQNKASDTFVGIFEGGLESTGVQCFNNSLLLRNFKYPDKENAFIVAEDGSWAYIEKRPSVGYTFKKCLRYLKSKKVLEFVGVDKDEDAFKDTIKSCPISFDRELGGSSVWQNLYGCKFEHKTYTSIVGRIDDFTPNNGKLNNGERWEDCAQKVNGESHGLGAIRWEDGNFYFGEWEDGWRTGFGMYHYTDSGSYSFSNYKKGDYFGDLKIEYSVKFDTFSIFFNDIKVHAYVSLNREGSTDSIFGITNDETGLSLDVFNDFSVCLFKKVNGNWRTLKTFDFSLDAPLSRDGNNGTATFEDEFNEIRNKLNGQADSNNSSSSVANNTIDAEAELNKLVGLKKVKEKVELFKASAKKRRGKVNLNFSFVGNPGTGKTVVARLFAQILNKSGLLPTANLVEVSRGDLVGQYIGESEKKTNEIIQRAMGGTLFIDEAYALNVQGGSGNDYGKQVVEILLKVMEDHRGELCIILAGYPEEMHDFFKMNSGFLSRIPTMNRIEFENYNEAELRLIAKKMIVEDPDIDNVSDEAFEEIIRLILRDAYKKNFDNARCVRNVLNAVLEKQIIRTKDDANDHDITLEDVRAVSEPTRKPNQVRAEDRLNQLIGLAKVKKQILSLKNTVKKFKNMPDRLNLHMAFLGNPGTGKTEVAKLIAEIFYDEGVLPTKNLIEVDPSGLIAQYVGQTGPKTHDVVQRALGGVLFVDEAYALDDNGQNGFGAEAVEALLKDMEEYRGKFCVILAGYNQEMLHLFNVNPGFKSRIPDHNYIVFPDYNSDELVEIAKLMVEKDGYSISEDAANELKKIVQIASNNKNFENARFVRNILQGIESVQNTRTVEQPDNMELILDDVIEYEKENDLFNEDSGIGGKCVSQNELLALPEINGPVTSDFIIERSVAIHTETKEGAGEGTGFIVTPDGYIVTNNHVIDNGVDVTVGINYILANGKTIMVDEKAKIIAADKEHDVAIIKIEREDEQLPYFTLSSPDAGDPELMSEVIMGGYPLGKSRFHKITLTTGKVQSINRDERISDSDMRRIYLDLSGTHGNSGSAVIDVKSARVIGIFSGASVDRRANAEINYAIPTKYIWDLINNSNK